MYDAAAAAAAGYDNMMAAAVAAMDQQQYASAPASSYASQASRGAPSLKGAASAAKKSRARGGASSSGRNDGGSSAAAKRGARGGKPRCNDPDTNAALAALTALANAAEGVSRFVEDHAKTQDAAGSGGVPDNWQGPQLASGPKTNGGGRNKEARARSRDLAAERLRAEQQESSEGNARAARGPRAASKFIGVTWRERIQRWEVRCYRAEPNAAGRVRYC
jgi:hypothetical protein